MQHRIRRLEWTRNFCWLIPANMASRKKQPNRSDGYQRRPVFCVDVLPADLVAEMDLNEALVLGSAVYIGSWRRIE